jgi:uncharacterized protein (DUF342 family)
MGSEDIFQGVKIEISEDRLTALLVIEANARAANVSTLTIDALVARSGLMSVMVRRSEIEAAIRAFKSNPDQRIKIEISKGLPPKHGTNPRFRPQFPEAPAPEPSEDGRVDPHSRSGIALVKAGDLIGSLVNASPGVDGMDVLGKPIVAMGQGELNVQFEPSVKVEADGRVLAAADGVPVFDGVTLRVSDRLHIKGAVDFSVGNFSFPNDIEIDKGIRDQFRVSAGRDIFVHDLVEAATVSAHRDAFIDRGMAAHGKGTLNVGRDLTIKYILDCRVIVGRDATVEAAVNGSKVTVSRHYRSPEGGFIGGHLAVSQQVVIGSLGAAGGAPTEVVLGRVPSITDKIIALAKTFPQLTLRASRTEFKLNQLKGQPRPTAQQAEEITELQFNLSRDKENVNKTAAALQKMESLTLKHSCVDLTVHNCINPGVTMFVGSWKCVFSEKVKGPLRITLDDQGEPLITDLTKKTTTFLNTIARVIRDPEAVDVAVLIRSVGVAPVDADPKAGVPGSTAPTTPTSGTGRAAA